MPDARSSTAATSETDAPAPQQPAPAPGTAETAQFAASAGAIRFGAQQEGALKAARDWLAKGAARQQIFRLFGYAGTGKTTLARHLAAEVGEDNVAFAAFTGKAALTMQRSGCAEATTIHALIYTTRQMPDGSLRFQLNKASPVRRAKLVIVDECSMVGEDVARDLLSFNVPVLVLGDPAQLPPVKSAGFFTNATPDVMLTRIHRQARDNPIVRFATDVREGRALPYGDFGRVVIDRPGRRGPADLLAAGQVLVGRNATRTSFNSRIRTHLGRRSVYPAKGDKLACLRNDTKAGVFNGGLFRVADTPADATRAEDLIPLHIASEDFPDRDPMAVQVRREFFDGDPQQLHWRKLLDTQHFDYGYALTTHKAQGSQWDNLIVYDESAVFGRDAWRWLYTAITRAAERLALVR